MFSEEFQKEVFDKYAKVLSKDIPEGLALWDEETLCLAITFGEGQRIYDFSRPSFIEYTYSGNTFFNEREKGSIVFSYLAMEFLS